MKVQDPNPCPIGVSINGIVAARIRDLVDEYGEAWADGPAGEERRTRLVTLLRAVLRSLRLEAVDGERYRLRRRGDLLMVERRPPDPSGPRRLSEGP